MPRIKQRILPRALVMVLLVPALALAQPKKLPEADDPYAPHAEKPADPYATPTPPLTKAPAKPAKRGKPVKGAKPAKPVPSDPYADSAPADPYADPIVAPTKLPAKVAPGLASPNKTPPKMPADPYAATVPAAIPARVGIEDLTAVQGLLAVQRLDGWLLFDRDGENPIANRLVAPTGHPTRPWFVLLPAKGTPVTLVHSAEVRNFDHVQGTKLTYNGHKDLATQLKVLLKGKRTVAIEYSAKAAVPSVSRVDAGTVELIRAAGVTVKSSETLVQFTKAIWGDAGRTAHYVAVHHLVEMRREALAFAAKQLTIGATITEYDLQQRLTRALQMRGLVGPPPVVAAGVNTADPFYVPSAARTAPIKRGDLIVISLAAKVDTPGGIWATQTWVAVADAHVPDLYAKSFDLVKFACDQALAFISDRMKKRRPVTGAEVDDATRGFFKKAGVVDHVMHRTGHSIDTDLQGGGADLDNFEVKDTRILTPGTGFTIGPGLYLAGQWGVRSEISVFLTANGPEVTTPRQTAIEAILAR